MDPEEIMNGISTEIMANIKIMAKAKTAEEKRVYSETIKNLCESLGVFLSFASDMGGVFPYDGDDDEPIPF